MTDEWQSLCLLYTSGTTGDPKGVVYSHRGAYLSALGNGFSFGLTFDSIYLWTLPMFHCSGWSYPWAVVAAGGTQICLRKVEPAQIFRLIAEHRVTHLCGAPIVLNMLAHAPADQRVPFQHTVTVATGGAAPPSAVFRSMEALGFRVTHLYGATETYGPATSCVFQPEWNALPDDERFARMARQGVAYPMVEAVTVADPKTMLPVPRDGTTVGEIMVRSNTVMKGYLKNEAATAKTLVGNWCLSGDLAVWHPDGAIEIKDRSKDIIISGGENISSLEVEEVLTQHPAVMLAAVVARPDPKWGENSLRISRTQARRGAARRQGDHCLLPGTAGALQGPKAFVYGAAAKDIDRKDSKVHASRSGRRIVNRADPIARTAHEAIGPLAGRPMTMQHADVNGSGSPTMSVAPGRRSYSSWAIG